MSLGTGLSNLENDQITIIKISFNDFEKVISNQVAKTKSDNLILVLLRNLQMIGNKDQKKENEQEAQMT
jgi:hypothetical protein